MRVHIRQQLASNRILSNPSPIYVVKAKRTSPTAELLPGVQVRRVPMTGEGLVRVLDLSVVC